MTIVAIEKILGKDFKECWPALNLVLTYEEDMYFISWLKDSIEKRQKYSEGRSKNRKGSKQSKNEDDAPTYVQHMENVNEIEDENFKYHLRSAEKKLDDLDDRLTSALDEIYLDQQRMKWQHVNFDFEVNSFREKVRGSPEHYARHDSGGIRLAFQSQLRNAKHKGNGISKTGREQAISSRREGFAKRHSSDAGN